MDTLGSCAENDTRKKQTDTLGSCAENDTKKKRTHLGHVLRMTKGRRDGLTWVTC